MSLLFTLFIFISCWHYEQAHTIIMILCFDLILLFNRLSVKPITNENVYVFNVHASVCLNGGECSIDIPILRNTRLPTIRAIITGETKSKQLNINRTLTLIFSLWWNECLLYFILSSVISLIIFVSQYIWINNNE